MDILVQNFDVGVVWRVILLDGIVIGMGIFLIMYIFGLLVIFNLLEEVGIIIEDVVDNICRDIIFVLFLIICFDECVFEIIVDVEGICNDNGILFDLLDDIYSFIMIVNGLNVGSSGWQVSIDGEVRVIGIYGSLMMIDNFLIGIDVMIVVIDIDDLDCGEEVIVVIFLEFCFDECGISQVIVFDLVCIFDNIYNFIIMVVGVGDIWEIVDGLFSGFYNMEVIVFD